MTTPQGERIRKERQLIRRILRRARQRAQHAGLAFTITEVDIQIPTHCPVLGIPIKLPEPGSGRNNPHSPSLDRIDASKGYTKDNIRVISWRANNLKSNGTAEEFRRIATYMMEHEHQRQVLIHKIGKPRLHKRWNMNNWVWQQWVNGKQFCRSTGTPEREQAEKTAQAWLEEALLNTFRR